MIIDFSYDVDSYQELLAHYGNWPYTCPVCNTMGQWQRHGTYLRYFLVSEDYGYEIKMEKGIDLDAVIGYGFRRLQCTRRFRPDRLYPRPRQRCRNEQIPGYRCRG